MGANLDRSKTVTASRNLPSLFLMRSDAACLGLMEYSQIRYP